jgi:hypothetical protein
MGQQISSHPQAKESGEPELMVGQLNLRRPPPPSMFFNINISPTTRSLQDESIMNHPMVGASHLYPPHLFYHDPSFNPLYTPYLNNFNNNPFQSNVYQSTGFTRSIPGQQPTQPSYGEDFKTENGFPSTFQGNFRELDNPYCPHSPLTMLGARSDNRSGDNTAASPSPNARMGFDNAASTSPINGMYMGI